MASTTDVRAWARAEGIEVSDRGKLKDELHERYAAAHPDDDEADLPGDYDQGVTADDFVITADEPPGPYPLQLPPDEPAAAADEEPPAREAVGHPDERQPRRVGKRKGAAAKTFRERVWGGDHKPARPAKKHPRMSLRGLAEDAFLDAAWTFQGLPPLEKILYLQAPLAGQVVEDTVRGTVVDTLLQPIARADQKFKSVEALLAPAWVAAIMVKGRKDATGDYSPETKLMFSGLRHSLLSMSRVVDNFDFEQQRQKAEELRTASGQIDAVIAYLFEMPEPTEEQLAAMAAAQAAANGGR